MTPKAATAAAQQLADAWRVGALLPDLSPACRPRTVAEGYQVQARLIAELEIPLGGWKIGCTSAEARKILKARAPFASPVFAPRIFDSGIALPARIYTVRGRASSPFGWVRRCRRANAPIHAPPCSTRWARCTPPSRSSTRATRTG
jgi:hypothetical protein